MLAFPPDISFLYQILSFAILLAGLKTLILDPMVRVISERERRTAGAKHAAADLRLESDKQATAHETKMQEVRLELSSSSDSARTATEEEERRILTEARTTTTAELTELRERLTQQAEAARQALGGEAQGLAAQMFERVVGRPAA